MPLDGARKGAPQAVQVADRFHLWQNLAKAVERCVAVHRSCLDEPAAAGPESVLEPAPAARPEPSGKYADRARRHHAIVHGLLAEDRGPREIARHLGWGLHTVRRYARAAWQELVDGRWQGQRPSKLDPFMPYPAVQGDRRARLRRQLPRRPRLPRPAPPRPGAAAPGSADRPRRHRLDHPPP